MKVHSDHFVRNITVKNSILSGLPFFPFTFLRMLLAMVLARKKSVANISLANKV
jgi:hypothetical protein